MVNKSQAVLFLFMMVFFVLLACLGVQTLSSMIDLSGLAAEEEPETSEPSEAAEDTPTPTPSATTAPVQVEAPTPVTVVEEMPAPDAQPSPEADGTATASWDSLLTPQASPTAIESATPQPPATTPPEAPSPTAPSLEGYAFLPDGEVRPDPGQGCFSGTIYGMVRDAGGNALEGVRIRIESEWTEPQVVETKGSADGFRYNAIVSTDAGIVYNVVVLDEGGQPASPVAQVVRGSDEPACWFELNWRRVP